MIALPFTRPPQQALIDPIVRAALEEDLGGLGDITSELIIPEEIYFEARLVARQPGTMSGVVVAKAAFQQVMPGLQFTAELPDGSQIEAGSVLAVVKGPARAMLTAERVALNFVGHLSGIASATRAYVDAVKGTQAKIVDTRKTTPGMRLLEKYAVRCGGGFNHRFGLHDAVLIKDNHIAVAGSLREAVQRARVGLAHMVSLEVEVDTLEQLEECLALEVRRILLDNMTLDELQQAVRMASGRAELEASGNITLATIRAVAETGVNYISSGAITHSSPNLDVALDF